MKGREGRGRGGCMGKKRQGGGEGNGLRREDRW